MLISERLECGQVKWLLEARSLQIFSSDATSGTRRQAAPADALVEWARTPPVNIQSTLDRIRTRMFVNNGPLLQHACIANPVRGAKAEEAVAAS